MHNKIYIGVIGANHCSKQVAKLAYEVGQEIAKTGAILVCGGLGGVMEAACQGAKEQGGTTIGIIPGVKKEEANPYVDFPIVTGLGYARNILVVKNSQAVIALPGKYGTLSEIAFCLNFKIPLISLSNWKIKGMLKAKTPVAAVKLALKKIK
ncbi:MAG: hypothetical protein RBG1_1C00001G1174 [candidate division Zixibacteria bacterium RBG-1]|nr:MAG: hypothetical protein RBG1_1C00001G1174 [candidate division Zixibacteria bacterium RBG-1]OGC84087.1 MAG: TIGR00725 family protein [candidate division Zixibacteria bacterium RBG_19FT_COMBO_42_43]